MMNENLYQFLITYRNESKLSGFKIDKSKNKVSVYASNSCFFWGLGIFMIVLGVFLITGGEVLWGLVGVAMGLVLIVGITKCTVFDIEKKEIRRVYAYVVESESIKEEWITNYHNTALYVNNIFKGYRFDLQYTSTSSSKENMMKGIAIFKSIDDFQRFNGVVTRIRREMRHEHLTVAPDTD